MSIFDQIAQGSNIGAGINAFAQNRYMVQQDQKAEQERQQQNAFARQQNEMAVKQEALQKAAQILAATGDPNKAYGYLDYTSQQYGFERANRQELAPYLEGLAATFKQSTEVPAEVQAFNVLTEGLPETDREKARRISLGLEPRATVQAPAPLPKSVEEYNFWMGLSPEERQNFMNLRRAGQVVQMGGSGVGVIPPGQTQPEVAVPAPQATQRDAERAAAVKEAEATAAGDVVPPETKAKAKDKLRNVKLIRSQLDQVRNRWMAIKDSYSAGPVQGVLPTPSGQAFDAAVVALAPFIRQLTRTPGEGAMSDYESKLAQMILPDRGKFEPVTEGQIQQLYSLLDEIESGYQSVLDNKQQNDSSATQNTGETPQGETYEQRRKRLLGR